MKNAINYAYDLNVNQIEDNKDYCSFSLNGEDYYYVPYKRTEEELQEIINCSQELKNKNVTCHDIIINREGKTISLYQNIPYIMLKVIGNKNEEYSISEMIKLNNKLVLNINKSKLYRNNWGSLWSSKIDYFEYQISQIGKDKKLVLDSFSYYIGLAEVAISYVNNTNMKILPTSDDRVVLSHRRIFYPNIKLNYMNPLSFIFDYEVRDVAEYVKTLFFNDDDAYSELQLYLKIKKLSLFSYQLLYARLLYPSYYFDIYEEIMNNSVSEEKLINIITKADDYELFLKKAYFLILQYAPIEKVDWIIYKKEVIN